MHQLSRRNWVQNLGKRARAGLPSLPCSALPTGLPSSLTPSEPQLPAKASGLLGPQWEKVLSPPERRSALFSCPFCECSAPPGENTAHRQSDTSMEHQGQEQIICPQIFCPQIICHQTLILQSGTHCPTTGVPHPALMEDTSAPPQFLAEHGKSKPRAPRVALNPSHFASMQIPAAGCCLSFPTRTTRMSTTHEWVHKGVRILPFRAKPGERLQDKWEFS